MRASDKIALVDKIGRELQSRFTFDDLIAFLREYKIEPPTEYTRNSKWLYTKHVLGGVPAEVILKIAEELAIDCPVGTSLAAGVPHNWKNTKGFRLFISHISIHKDKATRLRDCLTAYGISGFVAHEDIHPTREWQDEIERALYTMDAFLAMHTQGFSASYWTQQEIGFAFGRGAKVISLKMGEDPVGFIGKHQALSRRDRKAEDVAREIDVILAGSTQTAAKLQAAKMALGLIVAKDEDQIPF